MSKVTVVLRSFSFYFTFTFVLFGIVNIFSYFVLKHTQGEIPVIAKYGLKKLTKSYPGCDVETVREILHESWGKQVEYSSYVQFKESVKSGKYVNVSSKGFRLNRASNEHPIPLAQDAINIFVFGGSTTFGYGVRDYETIPARLEDTMRGQNPHARVYNFGRAFYFSSQERVLFEKLLVAGNVPDAVIFIDGLNEFYHPKDDPTYSGFLNGAMDNSFYAAQKKFFRELPIVNFARFCRDLIKKQFASTSSNTISATEADEGTVQTILSRYIANTRLIRAIAEQHGIKSFFVWQPVPEYHMDIDSHPFYAHEDVLAEANRKRGFELAKQKIPEEIPGLIWAAELSSTCSGNFVDKVHYSAKFNSEIAEFIFEKVEKEGLLE